MFIYYRCTFNIDHEQYYVPTYYNECATKMGQDTESRTDTSF